MFKNYSPFRWVEFFSPCAKGECSLDQDKRIKKKNTMSINEEKQFVANNSKVINETQIYKSKDLVASLDLMARLCK